MKSWSGASNRWACKSSCGLLRSVDKPIVETIKRSTRSLKAAYQIAFREVAATLSQIFLSLLDSTINQIIPYDSYSFFQPNTTFIYSEMDRFFFPAMWEHQENLFQLISTIYGSIFVEKKRSHKSSTVYFLAQLMGIINWSNRAVFYSSKNPKTGCNIFKIRSVKIIVKKKPERKYKKEAKKITNEVGEKVDDKLAKRFSERLKDRWEKLTSEEEEPTRRFGCLYRERIIDVFLWVWLFFFLKRVIPACVGILQKWVVRLMSDRAELVFAYFRRAGRGLLRGRCYVRKASVHEELCAHYARAPASWQLWPRLHALNKTRNY